VLGVAGVLVALPLIALSILGWRARASLPQTRGEVTVRGLHGEVTVTRDERGVPTIVAGSEEDAYFGLGYVHAQDRFVQMELQRLAGRGRLAEVVGRAVLRADTFYRTIGLARAAEASFAALSPQARRSVEAYTAGVNAWLDAHRSNRAPQFDILALAGKAITSEPWLPSDSLLVPKLMGIAMAGSMRAEHRVGLIETRIGPGHAHELFPGYPDDGPTIVGQLAAQPPSSIAPREAALGPAQTTSIGSNSWVIGPGRTTTGHPILANDPHLGTQSPPTWYLATLRAPGLDVTGATLPGLPVVIIGRNQHIAWGVTNMVADNHDMFAERPSDRWRTRTERLRVAGEREPVTITIREGVHGPILVDEKDGGPLALRWTGLDPDDTSVEAMFDVSHATDWASFNASLAKYSLPPQNFVFASNDGHIGYVGAGRLPIRARGDGSHVLDGDSGADEWKGFIPFSELPRVFDPEEGFIVTANNRVAGPGYPYPIGHDWAPPYRAARIRELILAKPRHSLDDVAHMQGDVTSLVARLLLPILTRIPGRAAPSRQALELLRRWDAVADRDSAAAALFHAWYVRLLPALFRDDLGDLYDFYDGDRASVVAQALSDPRQTWCDDRRTPAVESCDDLLEASLAAAIAELTAKLGPEPSRWRLGQVLKVRFADPVGGAVPVIGAWFRRIVPVGGDGETVRVAGSSTGDPESVALLSSFFGIFDLSPKAETHLQLPLGESAHPLSPHYSDQLDGWAANTPRRIAADATGGDRLVLRPSDR
jgi:penicillin amidase